MFCIIGDFVAENGEQPTPGRKGVPKLAAILKGLQESALDDLPGEVLLAELRKGIGMRRIEMVFHHGFTGQAQGTSHHSNFKVPPVCHVQGASQRLFQQEQAAVMRKKSAGWRTTPQRGPREELRSDGSEEEIPHCFVHVCPLFRHMSDDFRHPVYLGFRRTVHPSDQLS